MNNLKKIARKNGSQPGHQPRAGSSHIHQRKPVKSSVVSIVLQNQGGSNYHNQSSTEVRIEKSINKNEPMIQAVSSLKIGKK